MRVNVCVFLSYHTQPLSFCSPTPLLSIQTLMTASLIHARMEEPALMRSTPLCVSVCRATEEQRVRKVTTNEKLNFLISLMAFLTKRDVQGAR